MVYTEEEIEFIKKENLRFEEADGLFFLFMKKYKKRKKLKRAHFTKNKNGKYLGKTIFIDMIKSCTYSEEEKELLYKCLIAIPPKVLNDFEQLYIKSSLQKSKTKINLLEELQKADKEYLSLHNKFGMLSLWKDIALKEIKKLDEENTLLDAGVNSLFVKFKKMGKKHGMYKFLYPEFDEALKRRKINIRGSKKSILMPIIKNHLSLNDNPILIYAYTECGEDEKKLFRRISHAYDNYKRNSP